MACRPARAPLSLSVHGDARARTMSSVSSRTPSRSSARTITPHSKFLTTKPTPSPCTFANMFVSAQCVKGHWYFPVQDKCAEQEHTEMQKMLENKLERFDESQPV